MTDQHRPTKGFGLGRLFGARIVIQPSTVLMLILLAVLFNTGSGQELNRQTFAAGLLLAVLLFVSVFLHELAHAAAARAFGRQVREVVITLWGGHTSFDAEAMTPRVAGLTAAAGPAANLVIAIVALGVLATGVLAPADAAPASTVVTPLSVLQWVAWANVVLAVFNALPGIPMDGGRVLEAVVWAVTKDRHRGTRVAAWAGRVLAVAVVVTAVALPLSQGRSPQLFEMVWAMLIFTILWPSASAALRVSRVLGKRERVTVASLMQPAVGVPYQDSVEQARAAAHQAQAAHVVVLAADGTAAGHFPVSLTDAVAAEARPTTALSAVIMPLPRGAQVAPSLTGDDLIGALQRWWGSAEVWAVVDHDTVVGLVPLRSVMEALQ